MKEHPKEVEALFLGKDGAQGIKGQMGEVFKSYLGDNESIPKTEGEPSLRLLKGLKIKKRGLRSRSSAWNSASKRA